MPTPLIPEEDATLQAIESLEARTVETPVQKPILESIVVPQIAPVVHVTQIVTQPIHATVPPVNDVASAIAAELASAPVQSKQSSFKPFLNQKVSKKPFIIITIMILVTGVAIVG